MSQRTPLNPNRVSWLEEGLVALDEAMLNEKAPAGLARGVAVLQGLEVHDWSIPFLQFGMYLRKGGPEGSRYWDTHCFGGGSAMPGLNYGAGYGLGEHGTPILALDRLHRQSLPRVGGGTESHHTGAGWGSGLGRCAGVAEGSGRTIGNAGNGHGHGRAPRGTPKERLYKG